MSDVKNQRWVPSQKDGYSLSTVQKTNEDGSVDVLLMESGERVKVSRDDLSKVNPARYDKCEDMSQMSMLNEACVLHNLRQRYFSNLVTTYSGLFTIVVNPYKQIHGMYSDSLADKYKGKKRTDMPAHIFAVADEAYRSMLHNKEDQAILCTGESGAGKTENTKKVIQFLAHVASSRSSARDINRAARTGSVDLDTSAGRVMGHLEDQLLQANPILEAFGNSKTVKNDNSSRFGKFIRVHFDSTGCISGANIEFYLLEKSRVLRQAKNERSFHFFYQLLRVADKHKRESLLLEESASGYSFLSNGDVRLPGVNDAVEFKETMNAMNIMGFADNEISAIERIVSAVMLLGNLEFGHENKNSDQAMLINDAVAQKIANLLGMNLTELMRAFLKPRIKIQRDHVHRSQNVEQARFSVEAIAKALYERLFKFVNIVFERWVALGVAVWKGIGDKGWRTLVTMVGATSKSFAGPHSSELCQLCGNSRHSRLIIECNMAMFRFEIFDMNSFEQLCINYTNEKLQQLFNNTMFEREQQEYLDEGLEWTMIDFGLNLQPTIDLIDKPMGILSTLDDVCLFPQSTDQSYVERLGEQHRNHPNFLEPEMRAKSDFAVIHYAGRVDYSASGWRVKNMDPLNENVVELLQASKEPLVSEIWKDISEICSMGATEVGDAAVFGARVKKGMFRTVSQMYKEQLLRLMTTLHNTNPHFVRCVIPNHEKKAGVINGHLVLDQLRCNGVIEGIRICRKGYPNRVPFPEFRQRYERLLTPNACPEGFMDGKEAVKRMVRELGIDESQYNIGQSKIFFRVGVLAMLEAKRDEKLSELVIALQSRCRGVLARQELSRKRQLDAAIRVIQRNGLSYLRVRQWQWWRLYTKVLPLVTVTNKDEMIAEKEAELRVAQDKIRRSEVHLSDIAITLEKAHEERTRLKEKLEQENLERNVIDEERQRIFMKKSELEQLVDSLQKQLAQEEQRRQTVESERKLLQEEVSSLETQLEDEERRRQKAHLEKTVVEQKLKGLDQQSTEYQDGYTRAVKEKKATEERCSDLSSRLIDEEEKNKELEKKRKRLEVTVSEFEISLEQEKQFRSSLESAKRALEAELRDERDSATAARARVEEFGVQLQRKDAELAQLHVQFDEESATRQRLEREVRNLQARADDVMEDMRQEQMARDKAEKARKELSEELENYKHELEETNDQTVVQRELRAKQHEEMQKLQKQLEDASKWSEERVETIRQKYQRQLDELNEQLDHLNRFKTQTEKTKTQLETELTSVQSERDQLTAAKLDAERKRKTAETQLTDLRDQIVLKHEHIEDLTIKFNKAQEELESMTKARDADSTSHGQLLKQIALLQTQLHEATEALAEMRSSKTLLTARVHQAEDALMESEERNEELESKQEKSEKELLSLRQQLTDAKKRLDEEAGEKSEEMKRKMAREMSEAIARMEEAEIGREKAEKAKKKAQQETEDALSEMSTVAAQQREIERRARKFDQQLAEERANTAAVQAALEAAQQQIRDSETRFLNAQKDSDELKERNAALEKERKNLRLEVDALASTKDDVGKSVFELEKLRKKLEDDVEHYKSQVIELEDALQLAEDAKSRMDVTLQAAKQNWEQQNAQRDQDEDDRNKVLIKQLRETEDELETEQRAKSQAQTARKKADATLLSVQDELDQTLRQLNEQKILVKKANQGMHDAQAEEALARQSLDELRLHARDVEKKLRASESEVQRLGDELSSAASARRRAVSERDELLDELAVLRGGAVASEEKRRLEQRISEMTDDLEDMSTTLETNIDKLRKAQTQVEQLTTDLAMERAVCERVDAEKNTLAKTVRSLKTQLEEAEGAASTRSRAQLAAVEVKNRQLEDQLEEVEKERQRAIKQLRRVERRVNETEQELLEEKKKLENEKDQVERLQTRLRSQKRELEEKDEETTRLRAKNREEIRRVEALEEELQTSKNELARSTQELSRLRASDRRSVMPSDLSYRLNYAGSLRGLDIERPSSRRSTADRSEGSEAPSERA